MTTPIHHPEPDELLAYAAGSTPEWMSLVIACHLTYCPACREDVRLFEDLGGALLGATDVSNDAPAPLLDALPDPVGPARAARPVTSLPGVPAPLAPYFRDKPPRFKFLAPGLRQVPLDFSVGGIQARIIRFRQGYTVPEHRHEALEYLLVLHGELEDGVTRERFKTGDLSRREAGSVHTQHIVGDDPCTCLVVSAGPVTPTTWLGRVLKRVTGV